MVSSTVGHVNQAELITELDRKLILLPSVINVCCAIMETNPFYG